MRRKHKQQRSETLSSSSPAEEPSKTQGGSKPERAKAAAPPASTEEDLLQLFSEFLRIEVADGDASPDTVRSYFSQMKAWTAWCKGEGLEPAKACPRDVKRYREALVRAGYRPSSIAFKLAVLRRFYEAAQSAGLRTDNPAKGIRPPRDRSASEDVCYLSQGQLEILLRAIPRTGSTKTLRDLALIGIMALQGFRVVEIERASTEDLKYGAEALGLLVHGKGKDRLAYLRPDVSRALEAYLEARGATQKDELGTPLFAAVGNRAGGRRISRRGIRRVVDFYLRKARVKRPGLSGHGLRHTAATLSYRVSSHICPEIDGKRSGQGGLSADPGPNVTQSDVSSAIMR